MKNFLRITPVMILLTLVGLAGAQAAPAGNTEAQLIFNRAVQNQKAGRLRQALADYQILLKAAPDFAPALTNTGVIYEQLGQLGNAESAFKRVLAKDQKNENLMVALAGVLIREHKGVEAAALANKLLALKPSNKQYKMTLAMAYISDKNYTRAAGVFRSMIKANPKDEGAYQNLTSCYMDQKDFHGAMAALDEWAKAVPGSAKPQLMAAALAEQSGDKQEAIRRYEAMAKGFASVPALLTLARLYRANNEPHKSVDAMKRILKIDKKNVDALLNLGAYEYGNQHYKEAEKYWLAARKIRPNNPLINQNLAMAQARQGKFKEALSGTCVALNAHPKDKLALEARGYVLENLLKVDEALSIYKKWASYYPKDPRPNLKMALIYLYRNNKTAAWKQFDAGLSKDPKDIATLGTYADALTNDKQYDKAYSLYRNAMSQMPRNANIRSAAAQCLSQQNKLDEALSLYKQAIALDPKSEIARTSLAELYKKQKKTDLAIEQYKKVIENNPKSTSAMFSLASLYDGDKKYDLAADTYRAIIKTMDEKNGFQLRFVLAEELEKNNDFGSALAEYTLIAKSKDAFIQTEAFRRSGDLMSKQNKYDEAIDYYKKAAAITPNENDVLDGLSKAYEAKKQPDVFRSYLKGIVENAQIHAPYAYYAQVLTKAGKQQDLINTLEPLLAKSPDNTELNMLIASAYSEINQTDKAIERYKSILTKFPQDGPANKELGMIYLKQDNKPEAAACLYSAARQLTQDKQLLWDTAKLLDSLPDKRTETLDTYKTYLKIDPANQEAKKRVSELETPAAPNPQPAQPNPNSPSTQF